jgi:hypothetical protein
MRKFIIIITITTIIAATGNIEIGAAKQKQILNIPVIMQEGSIYGRAVKRLCGNTCAEMVLKYYGINNIRNVDIAETFCSKLYPEYNLKMGYDDKQKIKYSTNCEKSLSMGIKHSGMNDHVLQLYFKGMGFNTHREKTNYNKNSGEIPESRFIKFMTYVRSGIPVIIHVEDHYMLVIGYDDTTSRLYINDPSDTERIVIDYTIFQNRFNKWRPEKPHNLGWDGRFLAVWR